MIGAMPAVAVRHERRKKKNEKSHRPNQLMLKPHMNKSSDGTLSPLGSHAGSHNPSRAGSPTHGQHADGDLNETILGIERYGDECFYGKLSLLHFIIFFFLGGLTVLIVGAVQYKKEAGLFSYRHSIIIAGVILIAVGIILLIIKCICFRVPILEEYDDDQDEFLEKKSGSNANYHDNHSPENGKQEKAAPTSSKLQNHKNKNDSINRIETAIDASQKLNPV